MTFRPPSHFLFCLPQTNLHRQTPRLLFTVNTASYTRGVCIFEDCQMKRFLLAAAFALGFCTSLPAQQSFQPLVEPPFQPSFQPMVASAALPSAPSARTQPAFTLVPSLTLPAADFSASAPQPAFPSASPAPQFPGSRDVDF